jgi:hypothetical protein
MENVVSWIFIKKGCGVKQFTYHLTIMKCATKMKNEIRARTLLRREDYSGTGNLNQHRYILYEFGMIFLMIF